MIVMTFRKPRLYLRNDPDVGWTLAVWKWRVFFNVVRGNPSSATQTEPRVGDGRG